jgi:uncharacterized membrane protein YuzA (DUF378 family)
MKVLNGLALAFVIVGALNWGQVAVGGCLVAEIFREKSSERPTP